MERLKMTVSGLSRGRLLASPGLDQAQEARLRELVERRLAGEPLQYLEGTVPFGPVEVAVDSRALIPRPETEQLWELAVGALEGRAASGAAIVDLGTGSGVLALALKRSFPEASVFGVDISSRALALAGENARRAGLEVSLVLGDLFDPLPAGLEGAVTLIVSNPPYVAAGEWDRLPAEIRDYEPRQALVAGPGGTEVLARIAAGAHRWLCQGGLVMCEIGETQGEAVLDLFAAYRPEIHRDLAGRPRFVFGRKGSGS
jgi:release factor glutamine methyltransferase